MGKSRREVRRDRRKVEAKRLKRFEDSLQEILPPKGIVGPIERAWRTGKISDEQFWVATRFAGCYDATLPDPLLKAGSFECSPAAGNTLAEHRISRQRLGEKYHQAVDALRMHREQLGGDRELPAAVLAAAAHKISFDEIDRKLKKRKQWARDNVCQALSFLADLWAAEIVKARIRSASEGATLV